MPGPWEVEPSNESEDSQEEETPETDGVNELNVSAPTVENDTPEVEGVEVE